jgi:hypothetical protein
MRSLVFSSISTTWLVSLLRPQPPDFALVGSVTTVVLIISVDGSVIESRKKSVDCGCHCGRCVNALATCRKTSLPVELKSRLLLTLSDDSGCKTLVYVGWCVSMFESWCVQPRLLFTGILCYLILHSLIPLLSGKKINSYRCRSA